MTGDAGDALWGGRFESGPDPAMARLTASIDVDIALLGCDARATKAHASVLAAAGLLDGGDRAALVAALDDIVADYAAGRIEPGPLDEDVHTFVERELTRRLGDAGRRIHAGRSRNDLVAADLRLWCRDAAGALARRAAEVVAGLAGLASEHAGTVMPGYTHLQRAQPVTLGFHLLAHGFALERDARRFAAARAAADVAVLGAGALATTTLPLDARIAADELGFAEMFHNAIDAVSDRDFACDLVYAAALCGVHLSRLAEEVVLWTSSEFGFARLSDRWSTGSSMMPHKRNPDMAELVRGRAAAGIGDLTALLGVLKGIPLAYGRDLQEDKRPLFAAVERISGCLEGTAGMMSALSFDVDALAAAAARGAWATDLAEALVARGVPFRTAHEATGELVADLERAGLEPSEASGELLRARHPRFEDSDGGLAEPGGAVARRDRPGGPAPARVRDQAGRLLELASVHLA